MDPTTFDDLDQLGTKLKRRCAAADREVITVRDKVSDLHAKSIRRVE
jgi:hypothetical protein